MTQKRQTLVVTIDVTGMSDAQLTKTLQRLFDLPEAHDEQRLKYNLVDIDQSDFIAAEHALIDIIHRDRKSGRGLGES